MTTPIQLKDLLGYKLNDIESKFEPKKIYYKGAMQIPIPYPRVSIIGSREASDKGLGDAREITKVLVQNNVVIVSGLAKGIDTMGHKTAIKNGGRTIAVIGTPLNETYPRENLELQKEIMKNHLVISQYPVGHKATPDDFALRNIPMALISDATVIIESEDSGGALYQGQETLRIGRPLYITKSAVNNDNLKWPEKMIKQGAIELEKPTDILKKAYRTDFMSLR